MRDVVGRGLRLRAEFEVAEQMIGFHEPLLKESFGLCNSLPSTDISYFDLSSNPLHGHTPDSQSFSSAEVRSISTSRKGHQVGIKRTQLAHTTLQGACAQGMQPMQTQFEVPIQRPESLTTKTVPPPFLTTLPRRFDLAQSSTSVDHHAEQEAKHPRWDREESEPLLSSPYSLSST